MRIAEFGFWNGEIVASAFIADVIAPPVNGGATNINLWVTNIDNLLSISIP